MRRLARKSALSLKAREGHIKVVEDFSLEPAKTREMVSVLKNLGLAEAKTLLLLPRNDPSVVRAGRNIPAFRVLEADKASTYDLLDNQTLLIQKSAVEVLQNTFKN
jgi:large subunit ribosomal protein L4